jgi:type II secretory pathway pseudopilin PulG
MRRPRSGKPTGFALLELLISLLMLASAILAIGTSSLSLLMLEKNLSLESSSWRLARSLIAMHRAGVAPAKIAGHAEASGAKIERRGGEKSDNVNQPAGWEIWTIVPSDSRAASLDLSVRILPPAAKTGPATSKPVPAP